MGSLCQHIPNSREHAFLDIVTFKEIITGYVLKNRQATQANRRLDYKTVLIFSDSSVVTI